ncbi:hypothetical protein Ocin01_06382, partial [Orchesella cincta]
VKFFAIFDAVVSALNVVLVVSILIVALFYNGDENPLKDNKETVAVYSGIVIYIASHQLWMAVRLYNGAKLVFGIAVVARFAARLRQSEQQTTTFRFPFVVARRQQTLCPTVRVSVIDLPPTYFDTQNPDTPQVDPPPYCEISVAKSHSDITNSVGFVTT